VAEQKKQLAIENRAQNMKILQLAAALEKVKKKAVKSTDDLAIEQLVRCKNARVQLDVALVLSSVFLFALCFGIARLCFGVAHFAACSCTVAPSRTSHGVFLHRLIASRPRVGVFLHPRVGVFLHRLTASRPRVGVFLHHLTASRPRVGVFLHPRVGVFLHRLTASRPRVGVFLHRLIASRPRVGVFLHHLTASRTPCRHIRARVDVF
jgi:hypothetical protein